MVNLVKVEGSLDELRALFGRVERAAITVADKAEEVAKVTKKTKRKLSEWQRYVANSRNHIKVKSGKRKGQLDLSKMSKAFKRAKKMRGK